MPSTNRIRILKSLLLLHIPLAGYDFDSMFRCLVKLEILVFDRCSLPEELHLGLLPSLRAFWLYGCPDVEKILTSSNLLLKDIGCMGDIIGMDLSGAHNLKLLAAPAHAIGISSLFKCVSRDHPLLRKLIISSTIEDNQILWKFYINKG